MTWWSCCGRRTSSTRRRPGQRIAFSQFFGQHGYLPDLVDLEHNVNMHGTFIASGPGVREAWADQRRPCDRRRTDAGVPARASPARRTRRGRILYSALEDADGLREVTILNISDWHAQLTPLTEAADNVDATAADNPSFTIGGAAFLKPWFDRYRAEARDGSLYVDRRRRLRRRDAADLELLRRQADRRRS